MTLYKNILLAVDLNPAHDDIATLRAIEIAKACHANLYIVHAFQEIHTYGATQGYDIIMKVEEELANEARRLLSELVEKYQLKSVQQIFEKGPPKIVIIDQVKKFNIDLIVVGSHSRHGISVLLGSTVEGVTHNAPCDVLAVRVKE